VTKDVPKWGTPFNWLNDAYASIDSGFDANGLVSMGTQGFFGPDLTGCVLEPTTMISVALMLLPFGGKR
jgi:hypothetical protein